jgi:NTE family protein
MPDARRRPPPDSFALGTGLKSLIRRCDHSLRPADPIDAPTGPTLGLTFSGGGFRATLAALGVLRYLACRWSALRGGGHTTESLDELVIAPMVKKISSRSLKWSLVRNLWRSIGSSTRTDLLASRFDSWWFNKAHLVDLDPECRFIINAGNLSTGVRFAFERDVVGDYVLGMVPTTDTGIRVSQAVAASAAVPGAFAATKLPGIQFPCPIEEAAYLLDGGV